MQEKIYVRTVLLFIVLLFIAVIYTWYPIIIGDEKEQTSEVIPVSSHLVDTLVCERGQLQSPIDIEAKKIKARSNIDLKFLYNPTLLKIYNGHNTVHAAVTSNENILKLGDEDYNLIDIHFHYPSEHTIDGKHYDMEMHLVHENNNGKKAVVAALFKEGQNNELLSEVLNVPPSNIERLSKPIDLSKIVKTKSVYHYEGSLTTPPCTEGVEWFILKEPFELSTQQLNQYKKIHPENNRPIQQLNNREINQVFIND